MRLIDKDFNVFIAEKDIMQRVQELGKSISLEYAGKDPIIIAILNGAFMFASDLIKEISVPCQLSFVKVSSYAGLESTGTIKQLFGLNENLEGRHVILVDDIVDTGGTIENVANSIRQYKPASIEVSTLLLKPDAFQNQVEVKYVGFIMVMEEI